MANINLGGYGLFNVSTPLEPAMIVGSGEDYANVDAVPATLKYAGKHIYDKDNDVWYVLDSSNNAHKVPKIDGAERMVVLTQGEYDNLTPDENTLYFIKPDPTPTGV